ncbi:hypothetical protein [Dyella subtropica]|uniref:hypothetical protein n=1 Tax=Dyella subtropica TaxID=2992127 RepID=UPI002258C340|nr:hypothetical protein [Dyella subtropica]
MVKTRDELKLALDSLLLQVQGLLRQSGDSDEFWPMFASLADPILDSAGPDDFDWASSQITHILEANKLTPPEA